MGGTMTRRLTRDARFILALMAIFSCSENSITGSDGLTTDDINADANRIATVTAALASSSMAVGDTTRATAARTDYHNRRIDRPVAWTASNPRVARVDTSGLVSR